eukprot:352860-Chlamydomonas_euryale.AAC.2
MVMVVGQSPQETWRSSRLSRMCRLGHTVHRWQSECVAVGVAVLRRRRVTILVVTPVFFGHSKDLYLACCTRIWPVAHVSGLLHMYLACCTCIWPVAHVANEARIACVVAVVKGSFVEERVPAGRRP